MFDLAQLEAADRALAALLAGSAVPRSDAPTVTTAHRTGPVTAEARQCPFAKGRG